jgi:hypothetical protein
MIVGVGGIGVAVASGQEHELYVGQDALRQCLILSVPAIQERLLGQSEFDVQELSHCGFGVGAIVGVGVTVGFGVDVDAGGVFVGDVTSTTSVLSSFPPHPHFILQLFPPFPGASICMVPQKQLKLKLPEMSLSWHPFDKSVNFFSQNHVVCPCDPAQRLSLG